MSTLPSNNHANHEPTAQLAHIRLLNASPDTPAVDVFVNETRVAADLAFKSFTEYMPAEPGVYNIRVTPSGLNSILISLELAELMPDGIYTLAITGLNADLNIELIHDMPHNTPADRAAHPVRAFIRFINLSPYDTAFDAFLSNAPVVTALEYTEISDYIALQPGTYPLKLFNSRNNNLVLTHPHVQLKAGKYYAAYIVGLETGNPPLQVLLPLEGATYLP